MRDLAELNINEGGAKPPRGAPSEEDFLRFEASFGVSIPAELKYLLKYANGGHPELDSVGGAGGEYGVNTIYHLSSENKDSPENLWSAMLSWRSVLGEHAIPFANDAGGNQFFIDLADPARSVKVCLHDRAMKIVKLASNLETFLDMLEDDPEMI